MESGRGGHVYPDGKVAWMLRLLGTLKIITKGIELVIPKGCFPQVWVLKRIVLFHSLDIILHNQYPLSGMEMGKTRMNSFWSTLS